jgi:hypothetical protein
MEDMEKKYKDLPPQYLRERLAREALEKDLFEQRRKDDQERQKRENEKYWRESAKRQKALERQQRQEKKKLLTKKTRIAARLSKNKVFQETLRATDRFTIAQIYCGRHKLSVNKTDIVEIASMAALMADNPDLLPKPPETAPEPLKAPKMAKKAQEPVLEPKTSNKAKGASGKD